MGSITRRNGGGDFNFVEGIKTHSHFLHERNSHCKFCVGRNISNFQIHDIFTLRVNSSQHCLFPFALGFLVFLLGFLFLFHNSLNFYIVKFCREFVNWGVRANWEGIIYFQIFFRWVEVSLGKGNVDETVHNIKGVINVPKRHQCQLVFNAYCMRMTNITSTFLSVMIGNEVLT